jgi:type IV pilus assembly protein PilM
MEEIIASSQAAGLALSSQKIRGALLSISKQGPVIDQVFERALILKPLGEGEFTADDVKPLYMFDKELPLELNEKHILITSVAATQVLTRNLNIKLQKQSEIDAVLSFQAEPLLPYPVEEAVLDSQIVSSSKAGSQIILQAIRKDDLRDHLSFFTDLGLEPEVVTSPSAALAHFAEVYAFPSSKPYYVIHIDAEETICLLGKEGKLVSSYAIPHGYNHLQESETTGKKNPPLLTENYLELRRLISQALTALAKQNKKLRANEVLICGEGSLYAPLLSEDLAEDLKLQLKPPQAHEGQDPQILLSYALPIALALSGLQGVSSQINFRQNEYAYPYPWKRWKIPIALYSTLCLAIAALIFLFGNAWVEYKENGLRNQYAQLLEDIGKPYSSFESSFQKEKMGNKNPTEDDLIDPEKLSRQELMARILFLQTEISSTPDIFLLQPTVPRVSDLIAWLSNHPKIINEKKENQIEILSLQYVMVKRPTQKKKNERYQIRVDLEFTTPVPMIARELHDALITPNELIDPKGDVKWSSSRDRYKTSFFLRDRKLIKEGS